MITGVLGHPTEHISMFWVAPAFLDIPELNSLHALVINVCHTALEALSF
jgi:hypothetical protein